MQNDELDIITKVITDSLSILVFEGKLNKDTSNALKINQQSIEHIREMNVLQRQVMARAVIMREQPEKRSLEETLYRMNRGGYGDYNDCGEAIELDRIKFIPAVLKCLDCMNM